MLDPVAEIKARLDIVDVISKHVELKRAGRNYKAICPFHSEKTPSFVVFPETQTWRCFGACSEGGDVYSFLMKVQGWDFAETLRTLAEQTGVELRPRSPEQTKRKEAYTRLYELLETATLYYMHLLRSAPEAEVARAYARERNLNADTAERFQLGYSLDQWDAARSYLQEKGYTDDDLLDVGLLVEKEDSGRRYDRFRGRLMIPIRDLRGRVVGFGARTLDPQAVPKYLNSPQTDLFDKSTLLYGLDMAKKGIREAGQAVVVEGYMDVMQGQQTGFNNIIAQMGTALTETQLRQLKRYTNRLVLALDADAAGQQATLRGLNVARQALDREVEVVFDPRGLVRHEARLQADIRIVTLPAGYDPDKLIRSDPSAWAQLISGAKPVVEYIIDSVVAAVDPNDAKTKSAAVSRAIPIIRDVANAVERDHYTQYLARRLGVDERTLAGMLTRPSQGAMRRVQRRSRATPPPPPNFDGGDEDSAAPTSQRPASHPPTQELYCLNQLISVPAVWRQVDGLLQEQGLNPVEARDFADSQNQIIFALLQTLDEPAELQAHLDQAFHQRLAIIQAQYTPLPRLPSERMANSAMPPEKIALYLARMVLQMRLDQIKRAKREANSALAEVYVGEDELEIGKYKQQVLELEALRLRIHRALEYISNPLAGASTRFKA